MGYSIREIEEIKRRPDFMAAPRRTDCEMCHRPAAGGMKLFGETEPSYFLCDFCLLLRYGHDV